VVRFLSISIEDFIAVNHIVNNIALGDLLGSELFVRGEVLSVVVSQMVVAHDRDWLDSSSDQEIYQHTLVFGLSGFEVVSGNVDSLHLSELDYS